MLVSITSYECENCDDAINYISSVMIEYVRLPINHEIELYFLWATCYSLVQSIK